VHGSLRSYEMKCGIKIFVVHMLDAPRVAILLVHVAAGLLLLRGRYSVAGVQNGATT